MMIFIIPALLMLIGSVILYNTHWDGAMHSVGFFIEGFGIVGLVLLLVLFFAVRFTTTTYPEKRVALQETYQHARQFNDFERATITKDIADFNKNLAVDKYWNQIIWFDWFINDVIEDVKPIK